MRLFSLAEARALLPEVIPVLERLRDAFVALRAARALESAQRRAALADGHPIATGATEVDEEALAATLRECTDLLVSWDIQLKDPERGLIDFWHERDGEVVFLCYLLGEEDLRYWHRVEDGFAGRQPL